MVGVGSIFKKKIIETEIDTTKLKHVLEYLRNSNKLTISIDHLDKLMRNYGSPQFTYNILNSAYDSDPALQTMIKDFDDKKVSLFSITELPSDSEDSMDELDLDTEPDDANNDRDDDLDFEMGRPEGDEENSPIVKKMARRAAKL